MGVVEAADIIHLLSCIGLGIPCNQVRHVGILEGQPGGEILGDNSRLQGSSRENYPDLADLQGVLILSGSESCQVPGAL